MTTARLRRELGPGASSSPLAGPLEPRAPLPGWLPAPTLPAPLALACAAAPRDRAGLQWLGRLHGQAVEGRVTDTRFAEGLMRAERAGSGTGPSLPGCPQGLPVGDDSQAARAGRDGSWRCGGPHPGLQAGGESPRTMMHSACSRFPEVRAPLLVLDAHFGVSPLG